MIYYVIEYNPPINSKMFKWKVFFKISLITVKENDFNDKELLLILNKNREKIWKFKVISFVKQNKKEIIRL